MKKQTKIKKKYNSFELYKLEKRRNAHFGFTLSYSLIRSINCQKS